MNKITFNPNDLKGMQNLMKTYGDSKEPFCGENENGEPMAISIFPDRITVVTTQGNMRDSEVATADAVQIQHLPPTHNPIIRL
ncbi:MAG: hypothetical protein LUG86_08540 [Oscillospiraceae bacterium]|nr:hypothetical protein [Oscillospiraceae bacterium]